MCMCHAEKRGPFEWQACRAMLVSILRRKSQQGQDPLSSVDHGYPDRKRKIFSSKLSHYSCSGLCVCVSEKDEK